MLSPRLQHPARAHGRAVAWAGVRDRAHRLTEPIPAAFWRANCLQIRLSASLARNQFSQHGQLDTDSLKWVAPVWHHITVIGFLSNNRDPAPALDEPCLWPSDH